MKRPMLPMRNTYGLVLVPRSTPEETRRPRSAARIARLTLAASIQIARPLGLDPDSKPTLDAGLDDGSRVAICVPPNRY